MPRLPRYVIPGQPQHVIQRGNNRTAMFAGSAHIEFFLKKLDQVCRRFHCEMHAYTLMTNHVHFLLTPLVPHAIGKVMQCLGVSYVHYFNEAYGRTGTLWEGRYRATIVDSERYLLTCMRYIELNPVRAGLVRHPAQFCHSSYGANAHGRPDPLVTPHHVYLSLGHSGPERQEAYRDLFRAHISDTALRNIREATNKAWVLGRGRFAAEIERLGARQAAPLPRGGDRRTSTPGSKGSESIDGLIHQPTLTPLI